MERVEVAVVGGGVIGCATARALAARGVATALVEQFGPGHRRGSSHGPTRIFRLSYPDPAYVRMAVAAGEEWAGLERDAGERLLVVTGGLDAGPGAPACAAALAECGVEHSWLDADDIRARFGQIAPEPGERMLHQSGAGVCLADATVAALRRLAERDGARILARTRADRIEPRGDRVMLRTSAGDIEAGSVVVAAGPWTGRLLEGAVARPPQMTPTLQQVRYFAPGDARGWPTLIDWAVAGLAWYVVPAAGGAPGVKVAAHVPGRAVDPERGPFEAIDPRLEDEAERYVRQRLPGLSPSSLGAETCLYTMTADDDFVLDREGPVVVGGGCSGHAFKFGPLLGLILAGLATGDSAAWPPGLPPERFSLTRPALGALPSA